MDTRTAHLTELQQIISGLIREDGDLEVASGIWVYRRSNPTPMFHGESAVGYCAIAQGAKHVAVGDAGYTYSTDDSLITSIELPMISRVVEASPERPYLSLKMDLNPGDVRSVILASDASATAGDQDHSAFAVKPMSASLLDATVRLMRCVGHPAEMDIVAPMVKREIIFRLFTGGHHQRMRQIAGMNVVSGQIQTALARMQDQFQQPMKVEDFAAVAGMSTSSFYDHFKKVTGLTPLQYQKQLRLREARRLLQTQPIDAAEAGFAVGYTDASHFNREYKKMFGLPPMRDIEQLRESAELAEAS